MGVRSFFGKLGPAFGWGLLFARTMHTAATRRACTVQHRFTIPGVPTYQGHRGIALHGALCPGNLGQPRPAPAI